MFFTVRFFIDLTEKSSPKLTLEIRKVFNNNKKVKAHVSLTSSWDKMINNTFSGSKIEIKHLGLFYRKVYGLGCVLSSVDF